MKRYIESAAREQVALLPESLDDYVDAENPVRVIDVFVDELDLVSLGFERAAPALTGRPAYHPSTLLKLYIYGYLNRLQSSRRLERETQRNLELIWLTGQLTPDFKTIADFRKDNGDAIRKVCREFVMLCRQLKLFSDATVAIDGSKFKAVNNRDKNFTDRKLKARMEQLEQSIARYMDELDRADREPASLPEGRVPHLKEKILKIRAQMHKLGEIETRMRAAPDGQISLTDPDARSMATSGRGTGMVGYNVQTAVDLKNHMIVAHEVVNVGHDRSQLAAMAKLARDAIGENQLTAFADRGYFKSEEILRCEQDGIKTLVPKPLTSNSKAEGRFDKRDFVYIESDDEYRCPAGERAIRRFTTVEAGLTIHKYWPSACPKCQLKPQCTPSPYRRVTRWEHEKVLEKMQRRLDQTPDAARLRRQTVEHPFGTLKFWMGSVHFLTKTLPRVRTEMSLHVLAYNLKRAMNILGTKALIEAMRA
ncbi:IS1182 family transposase [Paraburkholderia sp. BL10I2N1]|uniref:IS1182 family transposase n=1 Tax=Paraburkholderia sp. BL10I2N1 TaxID=1938796 RepID=UPI001060C034|nr:IS1182 family transposase [Paraburkholderia sp. BL10I2N1]TDN67104.1 IS4 family transposase [Paraburkholderia sp. BL10I2N1]